MTSIFSRIVKGEIPCHKILEDDKFLAFLDVRPLKPGHTLIVPKEEIDYIFDIDDKTLGEMMVFAKKVAAMIKKTIDCEKIGVIVCGLEVPHAHVHLVPIDQIGDLNFSLAKSVSSGELTKIAKQITSASDK